jgi:sulfur-oxidizing protein SoxZ
MPEPIRIRAQVAGDRVVVRVLISHPMESGQRQDEATGQPVPAHFVREVRATLNGLTVFTAEWGPWVAKNPLLRFELKGARAGDRIAVSWLDNQGQSRSDEALVAP